MNPPGARGLAVLVLVGLGACDAPEPEDVGVATRVETVTPAGTEGDRAAVVAPPIPADGPTPAWRDERGELVHSEHWLPGPARRADAPRDPAARLDADQACRRCHASAAHEWADSQHAGSWDSHEFQRAFGTESRAFCQRCHAPEEDARAPVGEVSSAAASLGVACVTCHVEPGTSIVLAASRDDSTLSDARAPHPIERSVAFGGPQACAGCHEFAFPDVALRDHPLAMQSTITEHRRSAAADRSCADCHMPRSESGRRGHGFEGAYDPAMLARALEIEATRPEPSTVRIRLAPGEVGHAVPTGDLLRRIAVRVEAGGSADEPPYSATRYYGRRFASEHQASGLILRGEVSDERVGVGPDGGIRTATFTLPTALADASVRWQVLHQRVAQANRDPRRAPLDGEVEVASGVLRP